MKRNWLYVFLMIIISACGGTEQEKTADEINQDETEKVIEPLPTSISNRISIKMQFVPDEDPEIFILDLTGESLFESKLCFVILNKKRDTLFCRKNVAGENILKEDEKSLSSDDLYEALIQRMSTFFSNKSFSSPPYTINDPNSKDFSGNLSVWEEIANDTNAVCFEFSLLPNNGSEVIVYSRLLDSILVYDKTH